MGVNFSSFEIGRRALRASQLGVTITGQNIANVNTQGYTRQQVQLPPIGTNLQPGGSDLGPDGVRALRDNFVEARLNAETGLNGRLTARRDALAPVDAVFNDSNTSGGIQAALTNFFGAFRDLEAQPTSVPLRALVGAKAETLADSFQVTRARLADIRSSTDAAYGQGVDQVNTLTQQVADLNNKISIAENIGEQSSGLRDQRGELVRQLAELTGGRATEAGSLVTFQLADGKSLVVGTQAFALGTTSTPPNGLTQATLDGVPANFASGKLRGYQDALGEINGQIASLDDLSASVADRVNTLHTSGTDLDGNPGTAVFLAQGGGPVTAANIQFNTALKDDPRKIVTAANGAGTGDATVARALAGLLQDNTSVVGTKTGSFESFYAGLVTSAGQGVHAAEDALSTQQLILAQAQAQRDSVSGVSLDEEAVNLLQYQKAYEAAAHFLKVADEMTQIVLSLAQ
ncbi:MAG: flagellar hook-associated protein FlgK [Acidobacteria bacterium]|nr:flagellar hook-associated protein FlgK [Acidobacteriota bacterium]MBI3425657.1 flagellar hook-associated protein FlgK [Acidobacteriota bacterium]